ncbi:hypothetical protein J4E93_010780 [Alternaria ventricosa]|uniref:uncharacterized protein n=1 Tax=Alternaria ventricosa TaxID=1187951 RepID=UPI0020C58CE5|nr:uncharacterized protein J4E93_010780 [Alternaria ventricosa]KAI4636989.1 hypothetical protein J4E93_010780 [Alternaria ventricosa]
MGSLAQGLLWQDTTKVFHDLDDLRSVSRKLSFETPAFVALRKVILNFTFADYFDLINISSDDQNPFNPCWELPCRSLEHLFGARSLYRLEFHFSASPTTSRDRRREDPFRHFREDLNRLSCQKTLVEMILTAFYMHFLIKMKDFPRIILSGLVTDEQKARWEAILNGSVNEKDSSAMQESYRGYQNISVEDL